MATARRAAAALLAAGSVLPFAAHEEDAVDRLDEIAPALACCWHPLHQGDEATVRLSFRRDSTVFAQPAVTFARSGAKPDAAPQHSPGGDPAVAATILEAVRACTPLRFTSSMGGAIAGRILFIRLIASRGRTAGSPFGDQA